MSFLTNRGDGVFARGGQVSINERFTATALVAGQFNADAIDDVAIAADDIESFPDFNGAAIVYRSTAAFRYAPTVTSVGIFPTCVIAADLTGEGIVDLATCGSDADGKGLVSLLRGTASYSFAAPIDILLGSVVPSHLVGADLDADVGGRPDLLVLDMDGSTVSALYGRGSNPIFDPAVLVAAVNAPSGAVIARLDSDDLPDIAITSRSDGTVLVMRQESARVFAAPVAYEAGFFPAGIASADFNGDDKLDLLIVNNGSSDVTLLLGDGDGTFRFGEAVAVGDGPVAIVVDDLNGDGKNDFATADQDDQSFGTNTQSVSVVLNGVSPPFTPTPSSTATRTPTNTRTATRTRTPTRTPTITRTPRESATPTRSATSTSTPAPTPAGPADTNCDGRLSEADVYTIIARIFDGKSGCIARVVAAADITAVVRLIGDAE